MFLNCCQYFQYYPTFLLKFLTNNKSSLQRAVQFETLSILFYMLVFYDSLIEKTNYGITIVLTVVSPSTYYFHDQAYQASSV